MYHTARCHSNSDCSARDIVWADGTDVEYNASLYNIYMSDHYEHCTIFDLRDPLTSSYLSGYGCNHDRFPICSAPCDEEGEYFQTLSTVAKLIIAWNDISHLPCTKFHKCCGMNIFPEVHGITTKL